jgi:hypothetical protein
MRKLKYINTVVKTIFMVVFMLFSSFSNISFAQTIKEKGTQISDGTSPNILDPLNFSLMELNSKERGFLLPRMTTAERMRIPTQNIVSGMVIYNTSIDCLEFYNSSRKQWMSVCGDVGPATFIIPDNKCQSIMISGEYIEGVLLDARKNIITVEVNVSVPGTYEIEAIAYDNLGKENGYRFYSKGIFPQKGNYTLVLKGEGTPQKGYNRTNGIPSGKDTIKFFLNKKESSCKRDNEVEKKALSYEIIKVEQVGEFFTGVDLSSSKTTGRMRVTISNISKEGIVSINTETVNGIYFKKSRALTPQEVSSGTAIIELEGYGVPTWPIKTDLTFVSNSHVKVEEGELEKTYPYYATISKVNVTIDCSKVNALGEYFKGEPLTSANKIVVPVKVNATGRGKVKGVIEITSTQTEKIEFESEIVDFKFNDATNDIQMVEMKPVANTGKPIVGGVSLAMVIQMSSKGIKEYDPNATDENIKSVSCVYNLPIKLKEAKLKIYCFEGNQQVYGKYRMGFPLNSTNYVTLIMEVEEPGEYHIVTNTVDGIYFEAKGEFTEKGTLIDNTALKLYGKGTPTNNNKKTMILTIPTSVGGSTCSFDVILAMSSKTMLTYSNNTSFGYGFDKGHSQKFISSKNNFGDLSNSTVAMDGNIIVASYGTSGVSQLSSHIATHQPALISVGYSTTLNLQQAQIIASYVRSGGALLAATDDATAPRYETTSVATIHLINAVLGISTAQAVTIGSGGSVFLTRNVNDPILNGPFGDIRTKYIGDDATGGVGLVPSSLGSALYDIEILSTDSSGNIYAFRHKNLNFVWMGDGGFNSQSGTASALKSNTICPFVVDSNDRPISKTTYSQTVYNSQFTANALAWLFSVTRK